jgi:5-methylcytosine-specific restriction enzyme B
MDNGNPLNAFDEGDHNFSTLSKESILETIEISKTIVDEGLESVRLSGSKDLQEKYKKIITPKIDEYRSKYQKTPNVLLKTCLQNYIESNSLTEYFDASAFHFYGQKLNPYTWACITLKDPNKKDRKASYYPQLYILINKWGIKFGFDYGDHVSNDDGSVKVVQSNTNIQNLIKNIVSKNNELKIYTQSIPFKNPTINEKYIFTDFDKIGSKWNNAFQIVGWFSKNNIPNTIGAIIINALVDLLELFIWSSTGKEKLNTTVSPYSIKNVNNFGIIASIGWNSNKWSEPPTEEDFKIGSNYGYVDKNKEMHEALNFGHEVLPPEKNEYYIAYTPNFNRLPKNKNISNLKIVFLSTTSPDKKKLIVGCYAFPEIGKFIRNANHYFFQNDIYTSGNIKSQIDNIVLFENYIDIDQDHFLPEGKNIGYQSFNYIHSQNVMNILNEAIKDNPNNSKIISIKNRIFDSKQPEPEGGEKVIYPLNQILYGPPGTGKTYFAVQMAVEICDGQTLTDRSEVVKRFSKLQDERRIEFVTFHQSYSYEEFVEGIRPVLDSNMETKDGDEFEENSVQYELKDGIFKRICTLAKSTPQKHVKKYDFDESKAKVWKMSLGNTADPSKAYIYEDCIEGGYVRLGYGKGLDFSECNDRQAIMTKLRSEYPDMDHLNYNITSVDHLKNKMKTDDIVVVSDGNRKFRAIGRITGEYQPPSIDDIGQRRTVDWLVTYDESLPREKILNGVFSQKTLYQIGERNLKIDAFKELLSGHHESTIEDYVLIVDEINRGNISKILGELITLLEPDKRLGEENELRASLPYSGEEFSVPSNLFIIGTMNTADRSIAFMDTALRRRFNFKEMMPDSSKITSTVENNGKINGINITKLFDTINERIEFLYDRDHMLGHSYFMKTASLVDLRDVFLDNVIPLLQEYFYGDWEKVCLILGCPYDPETGKALVNNSNPLINSVLLSLSQMPGFDNGDFENRLRYEINKKFKTAKENDLKAFFSEIMNIGQNSLESE